MKIFIITGKFKCGEKIPSVRELSAWAKVNPNTMQKALIELEDEGLIYTERTNGKFVTENSEVIKKLKEKHADLLVKKYFEGMLLIGYKKEEAIKYLRGDK